MKLIKNTGFSETIEALEAIDECIIRTHDKIDLNNKKKASKFIRNLCKYLKSQDDNENFYKKQKYN